MCSPRCPTLRAGRKPWVAKWAAGRLLFLRGMAFARLWQQFAFVSIMLKLWEVPQWPWLPLGALTTLVLAILWGYMEDRLGLLEAEQQFYARRTPMLRDIHEVSVEKKGES